MRKPPPEYANWTPMQKSAWHASEADRYWNRAKKAAIVSLVFACIALVLILAVLVMEVTT